MGNKILVIDDDAMLGEMLKVLLEFKGYQVTVLKNPERAEEIIVENDIELILLDKLIAGIDGIDVCMKLKSNRETLHVPIIMMTALNNAAQACRKAGADGFLPKPFEIEYLMVLLNKLLNKSKN